MAERPPLIRQESVDHSTVDYDLIVEAMRKLYIPTDNYFKEQGNDGSVYIKKRMDSKQKFSFHEDIGRRNKIHLDYRVSSGYNQIGLQIGRDTRSSNIFIDKKDIRDVGFTPIELSELVQIENFVTAIESILYPRINRLKYERDSCHEEKQELLRENNTLEREIDRLRSYESGDSYGRGRERSRSRDRDYRGHRDHHNTRDYPEYRQGGYQKYNKIEDKDYKQLYIKYKSKYLKLKNKLL